MSQDAPTPSESDLLRSLLASRDIGCPVCAYNLRGSESRNCPECGANLDLRVGSTDLKLGPWLVAVLGLALPLGFIGIVGLFRIVFMIVYLAASASAGHTFSYLVSNAAIPILVSAGYGFLLWRLVRRRRTFWARPRRAQRRRAVLYAVLGPGALLVPMLLMLLVL